MKIIYKDSEYIAIMLSGQTSNIEEIYYFFLFNKVKYLELHERQNSIDENLSIADFCEYGDIIYQTLREPSEKVIRDVKKYIQEIIDPSKVKHFLHHRADQKFIPSILEAQKNNISIYKENNNEINLEENSGKINSQNPSSELIIEKKHKNISNLTDAEIARDLCGSDSENNNDNENETYDSFNEDFGNDKELGTSDLFKGDKTFSPISSEQFEERQFVYTKLKNDLIEKYSISFKEEEITQVFDIVNHYISMMFDLVPKRENLLILEIMKLVYISAISQGILELKTKIYDKNQLSEYDRTSIEENESTDIEILGDDEDIKSISELSDAFEEELGDVNKINNETSISKNLKEKILNSKIYQKIAQLFIHDNKREKYPSSEDNKKTEKSFNNNSKFNSQLIPSKSDKHLYASSKSEEGELTSLSKTDKLDSEKNNKENFTSK